MIENAERAGLTDLVRATEAVRSALAHLRGVLDEAEPTGELHTAALGVTRDLEWVVSPLNRSVARLEALAPGLAQASVR